MEKQNTLAIIALLVCAVVLGGIVTYVAFPKVNTVVQTKVVEVPSAPLVTEKVVFVNVTKEVIKNVEVPVDVPMDLEATFLAPAKEKFLDEIEDDSDEYLSCGGDEYDIDDIRISKVYDGYNVVIDDASDNEYTVNFKAKLKYLDSDVEEKCYNVLDVSVSYPKDHDSDVEVDIS
jgi:hypothetical protein